MKRQTRKWKRKIKPEYDKLVHEVLNCVHTIPVKEISERTFVSSSTIYNWKKGYKFGGTRYPQAILLGAVAELGGMELMLVPKKNHNQ